MEGPNGFDIFAREFGYSEENGRVLDETQNHNLERQCGVEIDTTNIPHMVHKEFAARIDTIYFLLKNVCFRGGRQHV